MDARATRVVVPRSKRERARGKRRGRGKKKKEIIWKTADTRYTRGICREPLALCHAGWFGGRGGEPRERGVGPHSERGC